VTGASTGIGAATARELARKGFHVLAGVRREVDADALKAERLEGLEPHILDITVAIGRGGDRRPCRARSAASSPARAGQQIAGIAVNSPIEALPIAQWRQQFEVNLFGHIAMTQALLAGPADELGTVVNISSVGGKVVLPTSMAPMPVQSSPWRPPVTPCGVRSRSWASRSSSSNPAR